LEGRRGEAPRGTSARTVDPRFGTASVGSTIAKGTRPDLLHGWLTPSPSRGSASTGIPQRWRHRCVPWQRSSDGQRIWHVRENTQQARAALRRRCTQLAGGGAQNRAVVWRFRGNPSPPDRACGAAQRIPEISCDAPAGAVVATSPVSMPCGRTVVSSLRLRTRRLASAFTSRPPSGAGDRRERVSTRRSRGPAQPGFRRRAVACCSATSVVTRSARRQSTPVLSVISGVL